MSIAGVPSNSRVGGVERTVERSFLNMFSSSREVIETELIWPVSFLAADS
jgi:hypothetical protein